jgi:hypothetical protein
MAYEVGIEYHPGYRRSIVVVHGLSRTLSDRVLKHCRGHFYDQPLADGVFLVKCNAEAAAQAVEGVLAQLES